MISQGLIVLEDGPNQSNIDLFASRSATSHFLNRLKEWLASDLGI
jgi:hypothetical protein